MRDEEEIRKVGQETETSGDMAEPAAKPVDTELRVTDGSGVGGDKRAGNVRVFVGEDDPFGREAHLSAPGGYPVFNPSYLCVLFLDFKQNWTMAINHASYAFQPDQDPAVSEGRRLAKAIAVIDGKITNNCDLYQVPGHLPNRWLYPALHQSGRSYDSTTFKDFKFKSPTEIFVFLNNNDLEIGPNPRLVRFTRYGSLGVSGGLLDQNYSFFRARQVTGGELGVLNGRGKLFRIENHARIDVMTSTDIREQNYSFNMRLGINGNAAGLIPLIIDPDTGNGTGNEP